jgi:hypothetical protein
VSSTKELIERCRKEALELSQTTPQTFAQACGSIAEIYLMLGSGHLSALSDASIAALSDMKLGLNALQAERLGRTLSAATNGGKKAKNR